MSHPIFLTDVTLRDGLQAESRICSTNEKCDLFSALLTVGYDRIELTSFVNPRAIPQLSDADLFSAEVAKKRVNQTLMGFVPNRKGLERLIQYPIAWVSLFIATSEKFNQKNVNRSIAETLLELELTAIDARMHQRKVRIYVSTVFGCPYQGEISDGDLDAVLKMIQSVGPDEVALSDTMGVGTPKRVAEVVAIALRYFPVDKLAFHFHDTYGLGLSCVQKALEMGITQFDGSTGGIGGCPYAKGATGNISTESLWYLFNRQGMRGPVPIQALKSVYGLLQRSGLNPISPLAQVLARGGDVYGC